MPARVPLDVDLEDRLVYGLTPIRFAYLALALLTAFALWSSGWAPIPIRGAASLIVLGAGASVAWGHWMGRPADAWLVDIVRFVIRTHCVEWRAPRTRKTRDIAADPAPTLVVEELPAAA
jgi:hypothetical protein